MCNAGSSRLTEYEQELKERQEKAMSDFKRVSNKELDDYNKKYLLSDAEQDVIKWACNYMNNVLSNDNDVEQIGLSFNALQISVKNYEEIKNKLR